MIKIKRILFPTDFSENAEKAYKFALYTANFFKANIELLYSYKATFSVPVPEVMAYKILEERKRAAENLIQHFASSNLTPQNASIQSTCSVEMGAPDEVIIRKSQHNDLIIMATRSKHNLMENLFGSITSTVLEKCACPILVIPQDVEFKPIKKIAYATDLTLDNIEQMYNLLELTQHLNAELHYVHVYKDQPSKLGNIAALLEQNKPHFSDNIHQIHNSSVSEGLNDFIVKNDIDLLTMYSPKKNFFQRVFHLSNARHMAFHLKKPLLIWR